MGFRVFYDKYEKVSLWGKDLYSYLIDIYQKKARYAVIFSSRAYKRKVWTTHEHRAAQARALKSTTEYILPARFDKTLIPGVLPTTGHIELADYTPKQFAILIKEKVGRVARNNYFPEEPDLLFKKLSAKTPKAKNIIYNCASNFFRAFTLMTPNERKLFEVALENTCPAGPPKNNIHLNIDYFCRLAKYTRLEVISMFSRLDCLGIRTEMQKKPLSSKPSSKHSDAIYIRFCPLIKDCPDNATFIVIAIFEILSERFCPSCRRTALKYVDFSFLSSMEGYHDKGSTRVA